MQNGNNFSIFCLPVFTLRLTWVAIFFIGAVQIFARLRIGRWYWWDGGQLEAKVMILTTHQSYQVHCLGQQSFVTAWYSLSWPGHLKFCFCVNSIVILTGYFNLAISKLLTAKSGHTWATTYFKYWFVCVCVFVVDVIFKFSVFPF